MALFDVTECSIRWGKDTKTTRRPSFCRERAAYRMLSPFYGVPPALTEAEHPLARRCQHSAFKRPWPQLQCSGPDELQVPVASGYTMLDRRRQRVFTRLVLPDYETMHTR